MTLRDGLAIGLALLVVPTAALAGLRLPVHSSSVLAPIFEAPASPVGQVRGADGVIRFPDRGSGAQPVASSPGNARLAVAGVTPTRTVSVVEAHGGGTTEAVAATAVAPSEPAADAPVARRSRGDEEMPSVGPPGTPPALPEAPDDGSETPRSPAPARPSPKPAEPAGSGSTPDAAVDAPASDDGDTTTGSDTPADASEEAGDGASPLTDPVETTPTDQGSTTGGSDTPTPPASGEPKGNGKGNSGNGNGNNGNGNGNGGAKGAHKTPKGAG